MIPNINIKFRENGIQNTVPVFSTGLLKAIVIFKTTHKANGFVFAEWINQESR